MITFRTERNQKKIDLHPSHAVHNYHYMLFITVELQTVDYNVNTVIEKSTFFTVNKHQISPL